MTTVQKLTYLPTLANWLKNTVTKSSDKKYHHRRLEEDLNFRTLCIKELQPMIHKVHEDARQRLRNAFDVEHSLDPLEEEATLCTGTLRIDDFPRCLDLQTLKGYFGEIIAAVIAENYNPLDGDWHVPVFPFRFHQSAYHEFERIRQQGGPARTIIGRFGDDMLAFQRNEHGKITHILVCEAKCSAEHNQDLIADAHKKASEAILKPVDCFQLAEMLKDDAATNPEAAKWRQAIINLRLETNSTHERCDLVSYVCGLPPAKVTTVVIPTDKPHTNYVAVRQLEAVEVHLYDVDGLIEEAYQMIVQPISCTLSAEELSTLWNKVVSFIPNDKQSLFMDHCCLLSFDEQIAVVGVRSLSLFRSVQRRKADIKAAFLNSGVVALAKSEEKIKIKLKVANFM
jgi:hypothetical protein